VGVVDVDRLREVFAIGHLRRADVGFDLELATHAVDEDVEVELAHALDDGLAGFVVGRNAERRIFGRETVERDAHLLLVGLGLRLHRQLDHRLGNSIRSRMIGFSGHSVSPVVVSLRPASATMSPA
jgi:hypothetical protein